MVIPVPTPSPGVPTGYPGYINSSTSGVLPQIGTSSCDFSGPWFIETQSMTVDYTRIPRHTPTNQNLSLGLSGTPQKDYIIQDTRLVCRINASVARQYQPAECYDTSSWQQTQKFAIVGASADNQGSSYGTDAEFTASTLGPQGSIVTYQPYYHRRPWLSSDTTFASSVEVYNSYSYTTLDHINSGGSIQEVLNYSGGDINETFYGWESDPYMWGGPQAGSPYTHLGLNPSNPSLGAIAHTFNCYVPHYRIVGKYAYNKEDFYSFTNMVDWLGQRVQSLALFPPLTEFITPTNKLSMRKDGLSYYDPNRHDWS
tara:strand:- start:24 stop:962 length:939 start_codon:yes stop_codon:yes gene_type:complete